MLKMILAVIVGVIATLLFCTVSQAEGLGKTPPVPPDGILCEEIGPISGMDQYATKGGVIYYREMGSSEFTVNKILPALTQVRTFDADSDNPTIITFTHTISGVINIMSFATANNEWSTWSTLQNQSTHFTIGRLYHHVSTALCFVLPQPQQENPKTDLEVWAGIQGTTYGLPPEDVEPASIGPEFPVGTEITVTATLYNRSPLTATNILLMIGNQGFFETNLKPNSFIEHKRKYTVTSGQSTSLIQVYSQAESDLDSTPGDGVGDDAMTIYYVGLPPVVTTYATFIPIVRK